MYLIQIIAALGVMALLAIAYAVHRAEAQLPYPVHHAGTVIWERCAAFDAWDRGVRKRLGALAGLRLFQRTSSPFVVNLVSRHWPHLTCWQWGLSWHVARPTEKRRFFRFDGMTRTSPHGAQSWTISLFWLGYLHYQRQAADRVVTGAPWVFEAPVIYPRESRLAA